MGQAKRKRQLQRGLEQICTEGGGVYELHVISCDTVGSS